MQHQWNSRFAYKLYSDVVIYYAWILGVIILATLANAHAPMRRLLYRRVWVLA